MDGSGRVTLRNRRFLRKIEPIVTRYVTLDDVIGKHRNEDVKVGPNRELGNQAPDIGDAEQVALRDRDVEEPRRSTRESKPPMVYEAKW